MSETSKSITANYLGAGWSAALSLITIPLLLSMLGAESYGLVSFFLALKAIATVFDFGLAVATNREVAFRLARKNRAINTFITTIKILYWLIGIMISLIIWSLLHVFLVDWVSTDGLTPEQLVTMSLLFAISLGTSWPVALYQNLLRGLGEHVAYNVTLAISVTFRNPGTLLILWIFSPKIEVFMYWHLIVSILEICIYSILVRGKIASVADRSPHRFNYGSLSGMKRFALGTGFSSMIATMIYQLDKILISRFLNLELLGYYSAILALVGAFGKLTTPIITAVFPMLTSTYGSGELGSVVKIYRRYSRTITNLLVPPAVALVLFSPYILGIWLPSSATADNLQYVLIFLSIAYMLYSMANMSIIIQMVFKSVNVLLLSRMIALLLSLPLLSFLIVNYGLEGAAFGVLCCSVFLYMILTISTSRRFFYRYPVNEPGMLIIPLLITVPAFSLLHSIFTIWLDHDLTWILAVVIGTIISYATLFRSYLVRAGLNIASRIANSGTVDPCREGGSRPKR